MENVITCPHCGEQYHPTEVYLPNEFFGKPTDIVRDASGKLDFILGQDMNLNEEFTCENCGCHFYVKANINFETTVDKPEEEYVTKFKKREKITLDEGIDFYDLYSGTEES